MVTGTILSFGSKGYGFVETDSTHLNVFLHVSVVKGNRYPQTGDRIRFDVVPSQKYPGKLDAKDVEFIESAPDGGRQ